MTPGVGEGEGGVGPTVGIEYSSRYTLRDERVTENIVCINCLDRYLSLNQVDSNMEIWMCGLLMEFVVKSSFMFEDFLLLDALIPN